MKKLLIFFSITLYFNLSLVSQFNGFKVLYIPKMEYNDGTIDKYGVNSKLVSIFKGHGMLVCNNDSYSKYKDIVEENPCLLLRADPSIKWTPTGGGGSRCYLTLKFFDCNEKIVYTKQTNGMGLDLFADVRKCVNKMKTAFYYLNYNFDPQKVPTIEGAKVVEQTEETEESIIDYLDNNSTDVIEGIYKYIPSNNSDNHYKIGVKKYSYKYKGIIVESSNSNWKVGEVKFILEPSAVESMYSCKYYMANKVEVETFASLPNVAMIEISLPKQNSNEKHEASFLKLYPSNLISSNSKNDQSKNNSSSSKNWKGNGSGVIITTDGYIVTNNHVIKDINDIEVEFKHGQEIKSFTAKVIKTDQINDLAIIKIDDPEYHNLKSIPYNFNTKSVDIGTEVFALGYPMALSLMGKDIKFTDGKISSKTGLDGNITTYQISASLLPGNSGGPLFDTKGNLIGINSSGLVRGGIESVGYTIKTNYLLNLIDVLPNSIPIPNSTWISSKPLTEQIKILSNYVVLVKVK